MATDTHHRRLAVIMATDAVGFSRLMHEDEDKTLSALRAGHELLEAEVKKHGGRIFSKAGDSAFAEFVSAEAAVRTGIGFQQAVGRRNRGIARDKRMRFRIGINLGTAVVEGDNLLGDCVNVAARLEGLSEPDGLCISGSVYEQVKGQVAAKYDSLGGRRLKNIDDPVRAYRVRVSGKGRSIYSWGEEAVGALRRRARGVDPDVAERLEDRVEQLGRELRDRAAEEADRLRRKADQVAEAARRMAGEQAEDTDQEAGSPVDRTVEGQNLAGSSDHVPQPSRLAGTAEGLALPSGPSVAVLPFAGDPEESGLLYCTDLVTEALIEALGRTPGLFVIARPSSFAVAERSGDLAAVGRRLGVRHLVVGQMRIVDGQLQTSIQLVDRMVGTADWEETIVAELGDLRALVNQVWSGVANRLGVPTKDLNETAVRPPLLLDSYAYARRARDLESSADEADCSEAKGLLQKAIKRDSGNAQGKALLSRAILREVQLAWDRSDRGIGAALNFAQSAVELDPLLPAAHLAEANATLWAKDHGRAAKACHSALTLAPNDADALETNARISIWSGRPGESFTDIKRAMRLDPLNPQSFLFDLGHARFCLGHYEDAVSALLRSSIRNPKSIQNQLYLAASYSHLRENKEAEKLLQRCQSPAEKIGAYLDILPYARLEDSDRLRDGLHRAGLRF